MVTLCKHLESSADPAQLLFTALGENGSYVLFAAQSPGRGFCGLVCGAASFLPISQGGKTEATRNVF